MNTFRIGSAVIAAAALLAFSNADVAGAANASSGTGTKLWVATVMPGGDYAVPQGSTSGPMRGTITIPLRLDELQG